MPGKATYEQAKKFAQAFLRGQPHKAAIATTLATDKIQQMRAERMHPAVSDPVARPAGSRHPAATSSGTLDEQVDGEVRFDPGSPGAYAHGRLELPASSASASSSRAPWTRRVAAVAVCRAARRPGAVPRRRHQPGRPVLQRSRS